MSAEIARQRYLQRHIEPNLPPCPQRKTPWHNVLVIPAYRESAALVQRLTELPTATGQILVILVLNRPDTDADQQANAALRTAVSNLPTTNACSLYALNASTELYLHDMDQLNGPLPAANGVGLARKIGCDIAFKWMCEGAINSRWICSTDADATLPEDYFSRLSMCAPQAAAAVYPFRHVAGPDKECNLATALYELRLHHYVLGLEYAKSPYAFHTLGSCLAVTIDGYAQVRGFPRRAGAEDFYLLNKLAKIAAIEKLAGTCIALESRTSQRVPFGTGPAVARIHAAQDPAGLPLFYHPACFEALRCFSAAIPSLRELGATDVYPCLDEQLQNLDLAPKLLGNCIAATQAMGLDKALAHCQRQGKLPGQFMRQFHQWFDGFRTLKFIHGLRDSGWPLQSLEQLHTLQPQMWPEGDADFAAEQLRMSTMQHWGWTD